MHKYMCNWLGKFEKELSGQKIIENNYFYKKREEWISFEYKGGGKRQLWTEKKRGFSNDTVGTNFLFRFTLPLSSLMYFTSMLSSALLIFL